MLKLVNGFLAVVCFVVLVSDVLAAARDYKVRQDHAGSQTHIEAQPLS